MCLFDSPHATPSCQYLNLNKTQNMNIIIESPHIPMNQIPGSLIQRKFNHLTKFYDRIEFCKVVLRKEKSDVQNYFFIEAILKVPNDLIFSSDSAGTFEVAIDKVAHDIEKQVLRYKEKLVEKR